MQDQAEISIAIEEIQDLIYQTESASDDITTLSDIELAIASKDQLDTTSTELVNIAVESIKTRLGIVYETIPADRSLALEDLSKTISRIWETIKKAINFIWEKLTTFIRNISDYLFSRDTLAAKKAQAIIQANKDITLKLVKINGVYTYVLDASSIATEDISLKELEHIRYDGPPPKFLLGEKLNSFSVGTSIVNLNYGLDKFINEGQKIIDQIEKKLIAEGPAGDYKSTYAYLNDNVPGLIDDFFGNSSKDFTDKFHIQPKLYYNREIRYTGHIIGDMALVKVKAVAIEDDGTPVTKVHLTAEGVKNAEDMRVAVMDSLHKYVKVYEQRIAMLIKINSKICDDIKKKADYQILEQTTIYQDVRHRLNVIKDTLMYLVSFIADKILLAAQQCQRFSEDVMHLYNFYHKVIQYKKQTV